MYASVFDDGFFFLLSFMVCLYSHKNRYEPLGRSFCAEPGGICKRIFIGVHGALRIQETEWKTRESSLEISMFSLVKIIFTNQQTQIKFRSSARPPMDQTRANVNKKEVCLGTYRPAS